MADEVKLFSFTIKIGEHLYGGHIPARNWKDAEKLVSSFGGKVDGELVESINENLCCICAGSIVTDLSNVKPILPEFDFPDESPIFD